MTMPWNNYIARARITPILILALPWYLVSIVFLNGKVISWESAVSFIFTGVGGFVFSSFGRAAGKKIEPRLWTKWGGAPTTILLRYAGSNSRPLVKRRHESLERLTGLRMPSEVQEAKNPSKSDEVYVAAVLILRTKTKDSKIFPLLKAENENYGFARNMLGLKPVGIFLSIGAIAMNGYLLSVSSNIMSSSVMLSVCSALISLWLWVFVVTDSWVKTMGFAYAERLLETLEHGTLAE